MYHLFKGTTFHKGKNTRSVHYWFVRRAKNGQVTSTSETYTRKRNAIAGMKSEIREFRGGIGATASSVVARYFYDHTAPNPERKRVKPVATIFEP